MHLPSAPALCAVQKDFHMFDRQATALLRPTVAWLARRLVAAGLGANALTLAGFGIGMAAALLVGGQWYALAVPVVLLSRLFDALDGAVARQTAPTDRGGFLDITLDFLFYAAMPLAFAVADPGWRDAGLFCSHVPMAAALCAAGLGVLRSLRTDDRHAHLLGLAGVQVAPGACGRCVAS